MVTEAEAVQPLHTLALTQALTEAMATCHRRDTMVVKAAHSNVTMVVLLTYLQETYTEEVIACKEETTEAHPEVTAQVAHPEVVASVAAQPEVAETSEVDLMAAALAAVAPEAEASVAAVLVAVASAEAVMVAVAEEDNPEI